MGRRATPEYNLAVCVPELAREWHPTKNGDKTPFDVTPGSGYLAWWLCGNCSREWRSKVGKRNLGTGCRCKGGRKATPEYNLAVLYPSLAREWHPTKNGCKTPFDFLPGSNKKVWWLCDNGHEYHSTPGNRVCGTGCNVCAKKATCEDENLMVCKPTVATYWHPTKNGDKTPFDFRPMSNKKVWWRCDEGHEWQRPICDMDEGNSPNCQQCRYAWLPFEEAREWVRKSPIRKINEWKEIIRAGELPENMPRQPQKVYRNEWVSWYDWFGTDWVSFEKAKEFGRLSPAKTKRQWFQYIKEVTLPKGIPRAPYLAYNEWKGWGDFLRGSSFMDRVSGKINIWHKKIWPYETPGKRQVCDMIHTELDRLGYGDLSFLSMPANGREIRQLLDAGFDFNYDECLGVEKYRAKVLSEFLRRLFLTGEIGGVMPVISDNIDKVLLDGRSLPEFNAIHLDYNGPLTMKHLLATEAALRNNPDAVVAVTVQSLNTRGLRIPYNQGELPFQTVNPELLFFQPYRGIKSLAFPKGCPMETYCFIGGASG